METIRVSELNANNEYSGDLMLDSKFLLLPAKCPLPQETIKALIEWSFTSVSSENAVVVETPPKPVVSQEMKKEISKTTEDVTELVIEKPKKDESKEEVVEAEVLDALKKAEERKASITNDHERMEMVQDIYMVYLNYINKVYTYYATNKEFKKGDEEYQYTLKAIHERDAAEAEAEDEEALLALVDGIKAGRLKSKSLDGYLVLKAQFYDAIEAGTKKIEYRDFTEYNLKRTIGIKTIRFNRGYVKGAKQMRWQVEKVVLLDGDDNECDPFSVPDDFWPVTIAIHLGKRIA